MDPTIRQRLEDLAAKLHLHRDSAPAVEAAHQDVQQALDTDDDDGLGDRLDRQAVELETSHPSLSEALRTIVNDLSASGL